MSADLESHLMLDDSLCLTESVTGVPGLIVAVSLGVKDFKQLYGAKELTMLDSNQTSAM